MRLRDLEGVKNQGSLDAFRADWHFIQPDPDNDLRDLTTPENRAHIERLKDSLSNGWRQGESMLVRVDDDNPIIFAVDGRCRLTALAELEAEGRPFPTKVTVLQEQRGTERPKRMLAMLSSGTDRKNLSDAEFARGLYRAIEFGYTEQEVCDEMRWKSVATLHNHLDVLNLKPKLKEMVSKGQISRTEAVKLQKRAPDIDPGQILQDAEDEQKRLNKKGPAKVRPRHVQKATGKPDKLPVPARQPREAESEPPREQVETEVDAQPPAQPAAERPSLVETIRAAVPDDPPAASPAPPAAPQRQGINDLINALKTAVSTIDDAAGLARSYGDDDWLQVFKLKASQLRTTIAEATGGEAVS